MNASWTTSSAVADVADQQHRQTDQRAPVRGVQLLERGIGGRRPLGGHHAAADGPHRREDRMGQHASSTRRGGRGFTRPMSRLCCAGPTRVCGVAGARLRLLRDRRGGHPRRRRAGDRRRVAFRDLDPQAPTHVLVVPRDPPRERRRARGGRPRRAGRAGPSGGRGRREGRPRRRLPAGLQHRRRGGPERLPHPPAPARRAPDDAGLPDEPARAAWSPLAATATLLLAGCGPSRDRRPAGLVGGTLGEPGRGGRPATAVTRVTSRPPPRRPPPSPSRCAPASGG